MKVFAVYNKSAGGGYKDRVGKKLVKKLKPECACYLLTLKEFLSLSIIDAQMVIAIGGDGTVNAVAQKINHSNVALGILPFGSGDGLARHLGFKKNISKLVKAIKRNETLQMDTALANGHFFINIAGIGFEALIAHEFANTSKRGFWGYAKKVIQSFRNATIQKVNIEEKGLTISKDIFSMSIANGSQWGNNFYIAPTSNVYDGLLECVFMQKPKWYQLVRFIYILKNQKVSKPNPFFNVISASEWIIHTESEKWHLDGEAYHIASPVTIKMVKGSLKILTP